MKSTMKYILIIVLLLGVSYRGINADTSEEGQCPKFSYMADYTDTFQTVIVVDEIRNLCDIVTTEEKSKICEGRGSIVCCAGVYSSEAIDFDYRVPCPTVPIDL